MTQEEIYAQAIGHIQERRRNAVEIMKKHLKCKVV